MARRKPPTQTRPHRFITEISVVREDGGPLRQADKDAVIDFIWQRINGTHTIKLSDITLTVQITREDDR